MIQKSEDLERPVIGITTDASKGAIRNICIAEYTIDEELELLREEYNEELESMRDSMRKSLREELEEEIKSLREEYREEIERVREEEIKKAHEEVQEQAKKALKFIVTKTLSAETIAQRSGMSIERVEKYAECIGVPLPLHDV